MRPHCRPAAQFQFVGCAQGSSARRGVHVRAAASLVQDEVAIDAESAKLRPVERVISAKLSFDDEGEPCVLYLAKWKVRSLNSELTEHTNDPCQRLSFSFISSTHSGHNFRLRSSLNRPKEAHFALL
jgi:hypothetical protein